MFVFLRIFQEAFILAIQELWANKLRTFLSVLGITIGIFCVISVLMLVDSVEKNVRSSFSSLGSDVLYVSREPWGEDPGENWWKYIKRPYPNYQEFKAIQDQVTSADLTSIRVVAFNQDIKNDNNTIENTVILGGSHHFAEVYNLKFEGGRYFTLSDSQLGTNVIVLGYKIAQAVFPTIADPVGRQVKALGRKMTVIGILEREGESLLSTGLDEVAVVPYNYLRRSMDVNAKEMVPSVAIKAKEGVSLELLKDEVSGVLRAKRKLKPREEDTFALNQSSILSGLLDNVFGIVNFAGLLIGLFSILVGGFGIANIMFVSVKERTGLIGIKKSLGAKDHFILFEFLTEAVCLCILGGLAGIALVGLLAFIGNQFIASFDLVLSQNNMVIGLVISVVIGVIAGFVPALNAARMNPVDAIRQNF